METPYVEGERARLLVIAEDPWARDTIRVLLGSMGCPCVMAASVQQARVTLSQESLGAAIVDAGRTTTNSPGLSGLDELCLGLRGRVVVLTDGGHDTEIGELIDRYGLPHVRRERLLQDLWGAIDSLLRSASIVQLVKQTARLIFDSLFEPAPAGIRGLQPCGRRFIYETDSLMIDLSLGAPLTGSGRVSLVGQIMDMAKPEGRLDSVSVKLRGARGQIAQGPANEFGEFQFEFNFEPKIKLDIKTGANQRVSVILPRLDHLKTN